jgi:hypothetical protein
MEEQKSEVSNYWIIEHQMLITGVIRHIKGRLYNGVVTCLATRRAYVYKSSTSRLQCSDNPDIVLEIAERSRQFAISKLTNKIKELSLKEGGTAAKDVKKYAKKIAELEALEFKLENHPAQ